MKIFIYKNLSLLTFLFVPLFFLWNPNFLTLMGVPPYWPIVWLFPWASIYGSFNGLLTGLLLGIILDSLNNDIYTQIPGLVICGFWFGKLTKYGSFDRKKFKYGLICSMGSFICNILFFFQIIIHNLINNNEMIFSLGLKNIFAQVFLTGLLSPIICNWFFYILNKNNLHSPSNF